MKKLEKPMYLKLYEKILKNIESKKYNSYNKLLSENDFANKFNVNRHTVRQALSLYKVLKKTYPSLEITKESTVFESIVANQELSDFLMMHSNSPILVASTFSKNQNGNFVEYGTLYFRGDTCKIKVDLIRSN